MSNTSWHGSMVQYQIAQTGSLSIRASLIKQFNFDRSSQQKISIAVGGYTGEQNIVMKNQGYADIILRSVRTIIFIDASFAVLVGLVGFALGWHTFEAYGMGLMWAGTALIFFSCLIGMGGVSSSLEDMRAFWLSGAGNMSDNLRQISEARRSSLGC